MLKTFWDLEEKERAALSAEEVERFVDAELMTAGVLKVAPLVLEPEPEDPDLPTETYHRVKFKGFDLPVVFTSAEAALAFVALKPLHAGRTWLGSGWSRSIEHVDPLTEAEVSSCQIPSGNAVTACKQQLERTAHIRAENEKLREAYEKATKAQSDVLENMWSDWHRCRALDRDHRRVFETFESYVRTAGGDHAIAARFLLKPFSRQQIEAACEWCGITIPLPVADAEFEEVEAASAPAADSSVTF